MGRRKRPILTGIGVVTALAAARLLTPYERKHYTCLRCRLGRTVETYWSVPRVIDRSNKCSKWYTAEHPDLAHQMFR